MGSGVSGQKKSGGDGVRVALVLKTKHKHARLQHAISGQLEGQHLSRLSAWRTIRVFISSTFTDFHGERDALVRRVFPALNKWGSPGSPLGFNGGRCEGRKGGYSALFGRD